MKPFRFSLADLLFLSGAAPIWVWLIIKVPAAPAWGENPFRFMVPPFALFGLLIIFYLSLSPWRHAWSAAALLSSICSTAGLFLLAAFAT